MNTTIGKYLIIIGLFIVIIGVLLYFLGDRMNWFGRLPGDIRVEKENIRIFIPLTTMILLSILITLILNFFKKIF
jgi:H+/Cl- antiporter ClcA